MKLQKEWASCVGQSEEKEQQREHEAKWTVGVELMEEFLDQVDAYRGWDGWVDNNNYEHFKERLEQCCEEFLNKHSATDEERREWKAVWPFADK